MKTKKPLIKETVGAAYYAFNTPTEDGEFNPATYDEIVKSPIIKVLEQLKTPKVQLFVQADKITLLLQKCQA